VFVRNEVAAFLVAAIRKWHVDPASSSFSREPAARSAAISPQELSRGCMAAKRATQASQPRRWSSRVTHESSALDLEGGIFTWRDPKRIATR
jgi:Protein of unknown function (DUF3175)